MKAFKLCEDKMENWSQSGKSAGKTSSLNLEDVGAENVNITDQL